MTAANLVTVYCETCGLSGELAAAGTALQARAQLRARGWLTGVRNPEAPDRRLDFCPQHRIGVARPP